jgi:hypothetical protein
MFKIDPSILLKNELDELIIEYKIKIITISDDYILLLNMYNSLRMFFNDGILNELFKSTIGDEEYSELKKTKI